jgi:HK97 family phage prohead protease
MSVKLTSEGLKYKHKKIEELALRASPITYSNMAVNEEGELEDSTDYKISSEDNKIKGYLTVWGVRDTYGTAPIKGAFSKSIQERGPDSNSKYKIAFLWQHDMRDPIGRFTVLKEDDYGLYFEAEVDDVPNGRRALLQVRSGTLNQFSYGFDYVWDKMEYDSENDVIYMYECELIEGSIVTRGSCSETYAARSPEEFKHLKQELDNDTEDFIDTLPRNKRAEIRQLITRHISLTRSEPAELKSKVTRATGEPNEEEGKELDINSLIKVFQK